MTPPAPTPARPVDLSMRRMGSGTAWLPDSGPLPGHHVMLGDWMVMVHYSLFLQYIREYGTRGAYQVGSVNWVGAGGAVAEIGISVVATVWPLC